MPNPQELIEIGTKYIENKQIIYVNVKKGNALYYIKKYGRSSNGCYIRIGSTCRSMSEEQIEKLHTKLLDANIKLIDIKTNKKKLSFEYLMMLFKDKGLSISDDTLFVNIVNSGVKFNLTEQKIISLIRSNSNITTSELASILNRTESTIYKVLRKLKMENVVERVGSDKTGYWKIKE